MIDIFSTHTTIVYDALVLDTETVGLCLSSSVSILLISVVIDATTFQALYSEGRGGGIA